MDDILIRPAILDDLETLDSLYFEFWEFHAQWLPERLRSMVAPELNDWGEQNAAIRRAMNDANSALLIGTIGSAVAGMAEIHLRQDDPTNNRIVAHHYVYVSCLIVREAWRGKGIGQRLMEATELWARSHEADEVRLDCWEFAAGPLAFYEGRGYQTLKRTLVKPL